MSPPQAQKPRSRQEIDGGISEQLRNLLPSGTAHGFYNCIKYGHALPDLLLASDVMAAIEKLRNEYQTQTGAPKPKPSQPASQIKSTPKQPRAATTNTANSKQGIQSQEQPNPDERPTEPTAQEALKMRLPGSIASVYRECVKNGKQPQKLSELMPAFGPHFMEPWRSKRIGPSCPTGLIGLLGDLFTWEVVAEKRWRDKQLLQKTKAAEQAKMHVNGVEIDSGPVTQSHDSDDKQITAAAAEEEEEDDDDEPPKGPTSADFLKMRLPESAASVVKACVESGSNMPKLSVLMADYGESFMGQFRSKSIASDCPQEQRDLLEDLLAWGPKAKKEWDEKQKLNASEKAKARVGKTNAQSSVIPCKSDADWLKRSLEEMSPENAHHWDFARGSLGPPNEPTPEELARMLPPSKANIVRTQIKYDQPVSTYAELNNPMDDMTGGFFLPGCSTWKADLLEGIYQMEGEVNKVDIEGQDLHDYDTLQAAQDTLNGLAGKSSQGSFAPTIVDQAIQDERSRNAAPKSSDESEAHGAQRDEIGSNNSNSNQTGPQSKKERLPTIYEIAAMIRADQDQAAAVRLEQRRQEPTPKTNGMGTMALPPQPGQEGPPQRALRDTQQSSAGSDRRPVETVHHPTNQQSPGPQQTTASSSASGNRPKETSVKLGKRQRDSTPELNNTTLTAPSPKRQRQDTHSGQPAVGPQQLPSGVDIQSLDDAWRQQHQPEQHGPQDPITCNNSFNARVEGLQAQVNTRPRDAAPAVGNALTAGPPAPRYPCGSHDEPWSVSNERPPVKLSTQCADSTQQQLQQGQPSYPTPSVSTNSFTGRPYDPAAAQSEDDSGDPMAGLEDDGSPYTQPLQQHHHENVPQPAPLDALGLPEEELTNYLRQQLEQEANDWTQTPTGSSQAPQAQVQHTPIHPGKRFRDPTPNFDDDVIEIPPPAKRVRQRRGPSGQHPGFQACPNVGYSQQDIQNAASANGRIDVFTGGPPAPQSAPVGRRYGIAAPRPSREPMARPAGYIQGGPQNAPYQNRDQSRGGAMQQPGAGVVRNQTASYPAIGNNFSGCHQTELTALQRGAIESFQNYGHAIPKTIFPPGMLAQLRRDGLLAAPPAKLVREQPNTRPPPPPISRDPSMELQYGNAPYRISSQNEQVRLQSALRQPTQGSGQPRAGKRSMPGPERTICHHDHVANGRVEKSRPQGPQQRPDARPPSHVEQASGGMRRQPGPNRQMCGTSTAPKEYHDFPPAVNGVPQQGQPYNSHASYGQPAPAQQQRRQHHIPPPQSVYTGNASITNNQAGRSEGGETQQRPESRPLSSAGPAPVGRLPQDGIPPPTFAPKLPRMDFYGFPEATNRVPSQPGPSSNAAGRHDTAPRPRPGGDRSQQANDENCLAAGQQREAVQPRSQNPRQPLTPVSNRQLRASTPQISPQQNPETAKDGPNARNINDVQNSTPDRGSAAAEFARAQRNRASYLTGLSRQAHATVDRTEDGPPLLTIGSSSSLSQPQRQQSAGVRSKDQLPTNHPKESSIAQIASSEAVPMEIPVDMETGPSIDQSPTQGNSLVANEQLARLGEPESVAEAGSQLRAIEDSAHNPEDAVAGTKENGRPEDDEEEDDETFLSRLDESEAADEEEDNETLVKRLDEHEAEDQALREAGQLKSAAQIPAADEDEDDETLRRKMDECEAEDRALREAGLLIPAPVIEIAPATFSSYRDKPPTTDEDRGHIAAALKYSEAHGEKWFGHGWYMRPKHGKLGRDTSPLESFGTEFNKMQKEFADSMTELWEAERRPFKQSVKGKPRKRFVRTIPTLVEVEGKWKLGYDDWTEAPTKGLALPANVHPTTGIATSTDRLAGYVVID